MNSHTHDTIDPNFQKTYVLVGEHDRLPKIVLVSPSSDPNRFKLGVRKGARRVRMPLGIMMLASHLIKRVGYSFKPAFSVSNQELARISTGTVVGLSTLPSNYKVALRQAEIVKESAKMVIFGGPYASSLPNQIITNQSVVDYIISGPGEIPLEKLLSGAALEDIPGLTYRTSDGIITNDKVPYPLYERVTTDYSLWPKAPEDKMALVYHMDGCPIGCSKNPCIFCFASRTQPNRRTVEQALEEEKQLSELGYEFLEDGGDDYAAGGQDTVDWLHGLSEGEKKLGISFGRYCHMSVNTSTFPGMLEALTRVGIRHAQIGLETGEMNLPKQSKSGLEKLIAKAKQYGVRFHASTVIGFPGETVESAQETINLFYRLHDEGLLWAIESELLWPGPSSVALQMLYQYRPEWRDHDHIEPEETMHEWFHHFCNLTYDEALELRNQPLIDLEDKVESTGSMLY